MAATCFVVLDLNGILADVRRKEAPPVLDQPPSAVLPNGQKAYIHPFYQHFLRFLTTKPGLKVITYTSRLVHNARPIEDMMRDLGGGMLFEPAGRLYGEDCAPPRPHNPFHPVKTLKPVQRIVSKEGAPVLIVDDHPDRFDLLQGNTEGVSVLRCGTYDALRPVQTREYLVQAMKDIWRWYLQNQPPKKEKNGSDVKT